MKKIIFAIILMAAFTSCKKEKVDDACGKIINIETINTPVGMLDVLTIKTSTSIQQDTIPGNLTKGATPYKIGDEYCK